MKKWIILFKLFLKNPPTMSIDAPPTMSIDAPPTIYESLSVDEIEMEG